MFRPFNRLSRSALDVVTSFVLIAAAVTVIYTNVGSRAPAGLQAPSAPLSIQGAPIRGSNDAETVMIVYSDFQCPFCGRFARDVLPEIERRYIATGQVALVFRHLPLPMHPQAALAAAIAECAGQQGQFWEMHDRLFAERSLDEAIIRSSIPRSLRLDMRQFDDCLLDDVVATRLNASISEANVLGIRGTPAFFLGKRLADGDVKVLRAFSGARPLAEFIEGLDTTLKSELGGWRSWIPWSG
jgi:protein-disulfide isomerase